VKKYTQIYLNYFGYSIADFVPCEICQKKAVDIHHIEARSKRKDLENDIGNLMAVCRECHIKFGDKKEYKDYLKELHNLKLNGKC
jgi:5-methylcytosine-specific restriction endonuclease McrA